MVQVKKVFIIILALICAFLVTELAVSLALNFPKYGVIKKVMGITTLDNRGEIYKPFSGYINNEDGYKVFKRNNAGLPGIDITISDSSKFILVLGNSFVEGYQVDPELLATSVFQKLCGNLKQNYQVVNLGASGHDAYDLWFRANFFDRIYRHSKVILVITEFDLFNHHGDLNFILPANFGEDNKSLKLEISTVFRNSSSLINLVATAIKYSSAKNPTNEDMTAPGDKNLNEQNVFSVQPGLGLGACLLEFNKKYGNNFIALSIIQDSLVNNSITDFCNINQINFFSSPLLNPQYEIKGGGHLNIEGNRKLGELLYESLIKSNSK